MELYVHRGYATGWLGQYCNALFDFEVDVYNVYLFEEIDEKHIKNYMDSCTVIFRIISPIYLILYSDTIKYYFYNNLSF